MSATAPDVQSIELAIQVASPAGEADARRLSDAWQERGLIHLTLANPTSVKTTLQVKQG